MPSRTTGRNGSPATASGGTGWCAHANSTVNDFSRSFSADGSANGPRNSGCPVISPSRGRIGRFRPLSSCDWYSVTGVISPTKYNPCGYHSSKPTENRAYLGAPMINAFLLFCSVDSRTAGSVSARRGIKANVGPLLVHWRRVRTGAVLRFAPLAELACCRSQTPGESCRVRQAADASGHLNEDGGPLGTATSWRTPGEGDTTSARTRPGAGLPRECPSALRCLGLTASGRARCNQKTPG